MLLANDVRSDIKAAKKLRLPRWAILPGIVVAFLCAWLFDRFGRLNLMLPIWNSVAVLGLMFVLKWRLRRHAWFWITMTVIVALHVPLILFVPWGTRWVPAMAIAAIDSLDFCLILWILSFVGNLMGGPREGPKTAERSE
jgi:chromate transport protein ChrA